MISEQLVENIVEAVIRLMKDEVGRSPIPTPAESMRIIEIPEETIRNTIGVRAAADPAELARLKRQTPARVAVGKSGARMNTLATLLMRADQAAAFDAVYRDVNPDVLADLELFSVETRCNDKDTFVTRPDLGRRLNDDARAELLQRCVKAPDVQIYVADGLSSAAVESNAGDVLASLVAGLESKKISIGTPFYLHFGRVGSMDEVSELLGAKLTCVLLGERPGLLTAESMSAYIACGATVGMPESGRTVVSNIHRNGTAAVEAGAFIADLIEKMLQVGASGVAFREKVGA